VNQLLDLTGLGSTFAIYDTLDAALAAARGGTTAGIRPVRCVACAADGLRPAAPRLRRVRRNIRAGLHRRGLDHGPDKLLEPATNGSAQALGVYGSLTLISVAFAHGLGHRRDGVAVGHISGGHFNPAVTLGFFITRRLAPTLALVYVSVQLLGATAGALLLRWLFSDSVRATTNLGAPALGSGVSVWQGVVIEGVLTFFLVWVIFANAADPGGAFKSIAASRSASRSRSTSSWAARSPAPR
jgi:hypothetical protein